MARLRQKYSVLSFMLVYKTHLGKRKTLNVGPPQARKKCTLGTLLKRFTFKNSPPQAENFEVFLAPFTFGNVFSLRISSISEVKILKIFRLRRALTQIFGVRGMPSRLRNLICLQQNFRASRGMPSRLRNSVCLHKF